MKSFILLLGFVTIIPFLTAAPNEVVEPENDVLSVVKRRPRCPMVTFRCSRMRSVCANIRKAFKRGKPKILKRITNRYQIRRNKRLSGCRRLPYRPGFICNRYPFASSRQGGRGAVIRLVPIHENSKQRAILDTFYYREKIPNGGCYRVKLQW